MNTKLYVDNLAAATTENVLMEMFSPYGNVADVHIIVDGTNHELRGFVTMATPEGARAAIQALNGKPIGTSALIVSEERAGEERAGSPNGRRFPRRLVSHLF
jgi:multiple RNA-binding domain-containing protein 1